MSNNDTARLNHLEKNLLPGLVKFRLWRDRAGTVCFGWGTSEYVEAADIRSAIDKTMEENDLNF